MLLRRIIEHVKTQNWTAIGLDFVIVVGGVFIGLQVSNWNDAQALNRQREATIDRLHDESLQIIVYFNRQINFLERANDARAELIPGLLDGTWRAIENLEQKKRVLQIGIAPAAAPPRTTYDEIVSTGFFAEIGDAELREAIAEYYAALKFLEGQIEYQRTILSQVGQWQGEGIKVVFDPDIRGERDRIFDLELLGSDEAYMQYLIEGHGIQRNSANFWRDALESAKAMCEELSKLSGKPCAAPEEIAS